MAEKARRRVRFILINLARLLLVAAIVIAVLESRKLLLYSAILLFAFSFLPDIFELIFKKDSGAFFDATVLLIIFGIFSYWEIRGVYAKSIILAISMNVIQAIAIGFLGLTLVYAFFKYAHMEDNFAMVALFTFCFSFSLGVIFEISEMLIDQVFKFTIQESGVFGTTGDLLSYLGGCAFVSLAGYFSLKKGKVFFISTLLEQFVEKNKGLLGLDSNEENYPDIIKELIKRGESHKLEFKSTIRKNLHTNNFDKNIEHAVLKTISAYLNSEGGTLLVGVNDNGEIIGIGADDFPNKEHANRHLNNLITNQIGAEFMPFIKTEILDVDGKIMVKIDCKPSNKEVFLKSGNDEEFYVRRGSLSMPISGSSLLSYIETKFRKKN